MTIHTVYILGTSLVLWNHNNGNTADLAMVQKMIIDTLKEGKSQRVITERGGFSRVLYQSILNAKLTGRKKFNEWMMHLYSALLCIAVHPKRFTIMWGVSSQPPSVCSVHLDDATAATGQRRQCAHHTPATGGEERESLSQSSGWGLLGVIDKGQWWEFGRDTGVTPLLFARSAMGFLMTTESQDLGLMSHPKDGALLTSTVFRMRH